MDQVPSRRALRTSSVVLLTALLGFLLTAPAADAADSGGTATYKYKVTDFSYEAVGQTAGGRFKGVCVPEVNALWQGTVSTAADDVADLGAGHGSLKIGQHGTSGTINAHLLTTSTLSDSFHRITTACDKNGNETDSKTTVCNSGADGQEDSLVQVSGGTGNRLTLLWRFFNDEGGQHFVPNSFGCVESFQFPYDSCETRASLRKFTEKTVKLPFACFAQTSEPPPGTDYSAFEATTDVNGSITLKRTKQS